MGLRDQLVGVTHECDYPASVQGLPVVTRSLIPKGLDSQNIDQMVRSQLSTQQALYSLRRDVLAQLQPDLIVSQALCDVCAVAADEVERVAGGAAAETVEVLCLGEDVEGGSLLFVERAEPFEIGSCTF